MGYGTRDGRLGHTIRTYWPDDSDDTMYIQTSDCAPPTLAELMAKIEEKWPGTSAANIQIDCDEIQTDCLGYDSYDPIDHTNFIIITKTNGA
jgi:hypothetical protein